MTGAKTQPFSPRVVLAMLLFGALAFLSTLYFIGMGETGRTANDGGAHVGSRGLTGYAALAQLLERGGYDVIRSRDETALRDAGLVVLTPPHGADGEELARIVGLRRYRGPTIVILPKWQAIQLPDSYKAAEEGWVELASSQSPRWKGFADDIAVSVGASPGWRIGTLSGPLPDSRQVQAGSGTTSLVPLVRNSDGTRILAGFIADRGDYPALSRMAGLERNYPGGDSHIHPLIFVFEPDLLDNYGMARRENALMARMLFDAAAGDREGPVLFDMTMNGLGRGTNLLTLAFAPPFLAATLCLLIAAIVVAWRGFRRFGPPLAETRAIAFGKRQLVANSAGFIRRTGRIHLLGPPYAELLRERIARLLGLHSHGDHARTESEIDRALTSREIDSPPFSTLAARLRDARNANEVLRAANALKRIERMLAR